MHSISGFDGLCECPSGVAKIMYQSFIIFTAVIPILSPPVFFRAREGLEVLHSLLLILYVHI
eukprot:SAG22_NODE_4418_length_1275_cov_1.364796_2_plen_62_part_00